MERSEDKDICARVALIRSEFMETFKCEADFVVRAPGRVNLIGEHIDYCGYSVFPMAVEQDILVAAKKSDVEKLELKNCDSNRYQDFFCPSQGFFINSTSPCWFDYFLCGVRAVEERFFSEMLLDPLKKTTPARRLPGMKVLVRGTIPPAAGLSSSSALVCAAALATLQAIGMELARRELAALCARCERFIGVEGGGMDQAVCLLAQRGMAQLIEFEPTLTAHPINLPKEAIFIVANSCVEINKGNTSYYNIRVVECRLAAQLLLKKSGKEWRHCARLCDVQERLMLTLEQCVALVKKSLRSEPYSKEELSKLFDMSDEEFSDWALTEKTKSLLQFELFKRSLHVFEEATRVFQFKSACERGDLEAMGKLMSESHASCRDLYHCSHEQLDCIESICIETGALGSRLTGAGWGGCTITLTTKDRVASIVAALDKKFYSIRGLNVAANVFVSTPAECASVFLS